MKRKGLVMLVSSIGLVLVLMALPVSAKSPTKPIKFNWISFLPKTDVLTKNFQQMFIDRVNKRAKGELVINFRGGPEAIGAFDQGKAVQQGIVDIAIPPVGFYEAMAPGIGGAMLTQLSPEEERRPGGGYDYLVELHKKGGLFYLGRAEPTTGNVFYLFLNKRVDKPKGFVGLKIGGTTVCRPAVKAWGATLVSVRIPEYYSAMERGLIDGLGSATLSSWYSHGCHEVTKYMVDHPYYKATVAAIMNLKKWNSLPQDLKKLVTECMIEYEDEYANVYKKQRAQLKQKGRDAGVKIYKFTPEVAKWFLDTAYNAAWEYQMKRFPKETPKLRELLTKK